MNQRTHHRFYRFGPNVLDCLRGVLWQDGVEVPLTPRVLDILVTLVQRHGDLVTKDEFMQIVWGGVAVEDNNLTRQISTLRKLLHERPGQREYIATVTGVGYRFVGAVTGFDEEPDDLRHGAAAASDDAGTQSDVATGPLVSAADSARVPASPDPLPPPSAPPAPPVLLTSRPSSRAAVTSRWVLGAIAAAAVAAIAIRPPAPTSAAPVSRTLWQFTHDAGSQLNPAWSPDGTHMAFASDRSGNADIWVHAIDSAEAVQLTTSDANDWQPDWSPDGRTIVFRSERSGGGIYTVAASGGPVNLVATFGANPRWSPRGDVILFTKTAPDPSLAAKLLIVEPSGGTPRQLSHSSLAGLQVTSAGWAPDGRVSVWARDDVGNRHFLTFPIAGSGPVTRSAIPAEFARVAARTALTSFVWASSGRYLYFEGRTQAVRNIWRVSVDPATLDWVRGPEPLTVGPGADVSPVVSPDGARLAFGVNTAVPGLWAFAFAADRGRIEPNGRQIFSGGSGERGADVTRDGRRIVYRRDRNNREEIWERTIDGEARPLLTGGGWDVSAPKWSHDGRYIAYQQQRGDDPGTFAVAIMDVREETPAPRVILPLAEGQEAIPTDWLADGRALLAACRTAADDPIGICEIELGADGGTARMVRRAGERGLLLFQQRYSPNQRWISFMAVPRTDRSTSTLYVMPREGGPWRPLTDGQSYDDKPRWSPDGRILYFISNRDGRFEVWGRRFDPESGQADAAPFRVTSFEGAHQVLSPYLADMEMFVTPDRILLPMFESSSRVWMLDQVDK